MLKWLVYVVLAAILGIAGMGWGTLESKDSPSFPTIMKEVFRMNDIICRPQWLVQSHADLKRHEGFRPYAYPDPLSPLGQKYGSKFGYKPARDVLSSLKANAKDGAPWTVGYGFTGKDVTPDTKISQEDADEKLYVEIMEHSHGLDKLVPKWGDAPLYVQTVLVNLIFNMGTNGLSKFNNTLKMFNAGDYKGAAENLTKSLWFKQVGERAKELTSRLVAGVIPDRFKTNDIA